MSLAQCIESLVRCACGDGNLLLNVGPMPDGRIEPRQVDRLRKIGNWLKEYGESIYATRGGPAPSTEWGGMTSHGTMVFIHVLKWPEYPLAFPALQYRILSVENMTGGNVYMTTTSDGFRISVPEADRASLDTIIRLVMDTPFYY